MRLGVLGLALLIGGLVLSVSTFRLAMQAARGEGKAKLRPLTLAYWLGLLMLVIGGAIQTFSPSIVAEHGPLVFEPRPNVRDDEMYAPRSVLPRQHEATRE